MNEEENKGKAWTSIAHECIEKYNQTEHTVTKFVPKYLLEGSNMTTLPIELRQPETNKNLERGRKAALENSIKYHTYNKKNYDKDRKDCTTAVGEFV